MAIQKLRLLNKLVPETEKRYFVTATGTGIGKTFITAALVRHLHGRGKQVTALKPVISGFDLHHAETSDTGILLRAQGLPVSEENIDAISPWRFSHAISPDMAAMQEEKEINFPALLKFCRSKKNSDYLLIEGAGGIMTPLNQTHTVLDWITDLGYETLLITGSYLGSISHTLTAYRAMENKVRLKCIIVNESEISPVPMESTLLTLKNFLPNTVSVHCVRRQHYQQDILSIYDRI